MKIKSHVSVAAIFLLLSAFGLGLCLASLSVDATIAVVAAAFFASGSLPSFLALLFLDRQKHKAGKQ